MDEKVISEISRFTLEARHILERENSEQLEGIYGWKPDGTFAESTSYPALNRLTEAKETRSRLEGYTAIEREAGYDGAAARQKLTREAAFTWLNRLVALRMMEERRLLKSTVSRLHDSNAYILWLADEKDIEAVKQHDEGELPLNAMGEGPRHIAYRRFLLWQCGELSKDVPVLFDPQTLASRLFPRPEVLKQLVIAMNAESIAEAWKVGNEETIGWIYQAFNAEELQAAFASAREQGKKFSPEDIPAVTQLFTIRWVVRYLVENSLGRLWLEMHPDSRLKDKLGYLVPLPVQQSRPLKKASEITFLDPACGSMHFGLVAFNIFVEMYLEELENAGKPGWPEEPSVFSKDDIATAIISHNINGIDLDLRAVQLSALTLFLRARTFNPKCAFADSNLACANVEQITGGRLEEFINQAHFSHPIYQRILRRLAVKLKDSNNLGSLLRLEADLADLIEEERRKARVDPQFMLAFPGVTAEQFKTQEGLEEFFSILEEQIMRQLDEFVRSSGNGGGELTHFAHEASKGIRFLRLVQQRYDIVTTNPPYLSRRKMNSRLAELLDDNYPAGKSDLYACFINRCQELLDISGLMGILTMHSFMFISSYENLRSSLREEVFVVTLAHFGGGLFAVGNPGTLQTAAYVLRRELSPSFREGSVGVYFRLVHERDADAKRTAFESALSALRAGQQHPQVFHYRQKDFAAIPGKPWVYWMPEKIRRLFRTLPLLGTIAEPRQGLATADNTRFVRCWWEVGTEKIGFSMIDRASALKSQKRWFPYMKGGATSPWFGNQECVVDWLYDGKAIRNFSDNTGYIRSRPQNTEFYFRRGVTWSLISSKGFAARISPGGFIFDVAGMTCFPPENLVELVLATLNSRPAKFILSALNPTINYQVGDIERLPVPSQRSDELASLVNQCIELAKQDSRDSEITYDFIQPLISIEELAIRKKLLAEYEAEIDNEVAKLYGLTDVDMKAIERELAGGTAPTENDSDEGDNAEESDEVAEAMSPVTWAQRWISYAAGIVLSRFEIGIPNGLGCGNFSQDINERLKRLVVADGILVNDPDQPLDLAARVLQALEIMLGTDETRKRISTALGIGNPLELLRGWFNRFSGQPDTSFWKYHFQLYRKRPIYWPLQSPNRLYTVWIFHERFNRDTLFSVRNSIIEPRLRMTERQIVDLRERGNGGRRVEREIDRLLDLADDLRHFSSKLKEIIERGYTPHIDDGVLLNAAPLYEILPSWPETKKAWQELAEGKYDWAQQAMEYWSERVIAACRKNKSFAIAHGLESLYQETAETEASSGRRRNRSLRG